MPRSRERRVAILKRCRRFSAHVHAKIRVDEECSRKRGKEEVEETLDRVAGQVASWGKDQIRLVYRGKYIWAGTGKVSAQVVH